MLAAGASERGECEKGLGAGLGTGQLAARCQPQENQKDPGQVSKPLGRRAPRRPAASTLESRHKKGPPGWEPRHHSAVTRLQGLPLPLRTLPPACTKAGDVWGTGGGGCRPGKAPVPHPLQGASSCQTVPQGLEPCRAHPQPWRIRVHGAAQLHLLTLAGLHCRGPGGGGHFHRPPGPRPQCADWATAR